MSNISLEQMVGWAREIDSQMPVPEHPEDFSAPVPFGDFGVVVMSDNAPMLVAVDSDPESLLASEGVRVFAQGYGSFFLISYGLCVQRDLDTDEEQTHVGRAIVGMTYDGITTALMRFLDTDEVQVDEEGVGAGSVHDLMKEAFA